MKYIFFKQGFHPLDDLQKDRLREQRESKRQTDKEFRDCRRAHQ